MNKRLLLTSSGLCEEVKGSFLSLLDKKPEKTLVAFIPTAAHPEVNKWFVEKVKNQIRNLGMQIVLTDTQAVLVKNEKSEIVGTGKKLILNKL